MGRRTHAPFYGLDMPTNYGIITVDFDKEGIITVAVSLKMYLIVCPLVFLAGFVDSVAGGGGTISLPAYLLAGLPAHLAAGTNKFAMSFGTLTATINYMKSGKVLWRAAIFSAIGAILGSYIGVRLALFFSEHTLKLLLLAALPCVAVFLTVKKSFGSDKAQLKGYSAPVFAGISLGIGLLIGIYDGLIGPGTGTFLIIAYSGLLGMDLLTASGCAKVCNLASNITALVVYAASGQVLYRLALPAMGFCILGNWLGARFAIRGGSKNVRKVMFLVLALLFVKAALDLLDITI